MMRFFQWTVLGCVMTMMLVSCSTRSGFAPVVEAQWQREHGHLNHHVVKRGETLYAIAFSHDLDYQYLASMNQLRSPYVLRVGQVLRLNPSVSRHPSSYAPSLRKWSNQRAYTMARTHSTLHRVAMPHGRWSWPLKGRIVENFSPSQGRKGLDIAGKKGDKIRASSSGVVAYAGNGLSGYGNLIIIKHDQQILTAYGHNSRNLVHEGQHVSAGQAIADIGVVDRRFWGVHFEMRQSGTPMNPLNYLP